MALRLCCPRCRCLAGSSFPAPLPFVPRCRWPGRQKERRPLGASVVLGSPGRAAVGRRGVSPRTRPLPTVRAAKVHPRSCQRGGRLRRRATPPTAAGPHVYLLRRVKDHSAGYAALPVLCREHVSATGQPFGLRFGSLRRFALSFMPKRRATSLRSYALAGARAGRLVSPPYFDLWRPGVLPVTATSRTPWFRAVRHPCRLLARNPRVRGRAKGTQAFDVPRDGTLVPLATVRGGSTPHGPPFRPLDAGGLPGGIGGPGEWGPRSPPRLFRHSRLECARLMVPYPPCAPVGGAELPAGASFCRKMHIMRHISLDTFDRPSIIATPVRRHEGTAHCRFTDDRE